MADSRDGGGYFALGTLLGAALGAALGLLYAPRPGAETRRGLADRSEDLRDRAQQLGSELETRTENLRERAREYVPQVELNRSPGAGRKAEGGQPEEAPGGTEPDLPTGEDLL